MSDVPDGSLGKQLSGAEGKSIHGRHVRKGSSHRKDLSRSRSGSSQRECSRRVHKHTRGHGSDSEGECDPPPTYPLPSTSRDEVNSPPWAIVVEALAELRGDMKKLKEDRSLATGGATDVSTARDLGECKQPPHRDAWFRLNRWFFWFSIGSAS